jgi:hypothetical protein
MMPFKSKLAAALSLLASSGISKLSYAPIGYRLFWHFGVHIPPPHFLTLVGAIAMNAISLSLTFFGLTLALSDNPDLIATLQAGFITGVLGAALVATFPASLNRTAHV